MIALESDWALRHFANPTATRWPREFYIFVHQLTVMHNPIKPSVGGLVSILPKARSGEAYVKCLPSPRGG